MGRKFSIKKSAFLLFFVSFISVAQHTENTNVTSKPEQEKDLKTTIKEYINHHILDSYDFGLYSFKDDQGETVHRGFSLPIILWDNGLKVFMSSRFHHGEAIAHVGDNYYKILHNKIYKTNAEGAISLDAEHHPTNVKPLDFSITKNVVMIFIVFLIMFFMFSRMASGYKKNNGMPKGMGRLLEPIVIYIRDEIAKPNIGEKHYKRYMSYLLTIFFFVWIVNLFGLTPIGVNITNNIAVTFCLAIFTYIITTFTAKKDYWKHVFWMPGVPVPMKIILAPIELLGTLIKPFSLMIRLYANITAGHIVLMSIIGMMFVFNNWLGSSLSFLLAFLLGLLELLVAALQAYIFTILSALYFGMAVEEHDEQH